MDLHIARARFRFLADAFNGSGGFRPSTYVRWGALRIATHGPDGSSVATTRHVPESTGITYLVPHARETPERYAARCAVAHYENHLREACERFVGYLGRRRPMRSGTESPLVQLLLQDATLQGVPLDNFLLALALQVKARGSMLVAVDMPDQEPAVSLLDQIERRGAPYLRMVEPEHITEFDIDAESGLFRSVSIDCMEDVEGTLRACVRTWDAQGWRITYHDEVVRSGAHPFGRCPVLAVTESGDEFPAVGKFEQIAAMSLRLFNLWSELDEQLRGQTFSVLTMQVPPDATEFDSTASVTSIGVHSMLLHPGVTPAFIAPDSGPPETCLKAIESLQASIKRVAMDEATTEGNGAESGVARRLRFGRLNADLASFARQMQGLEQRIWALFGRGLGLSVGVTTEWPSDFNLVDTSTELDILAAMQAGGFGPKALALKRTTIAAAEFDAADEDDKAAVVAEAGEPTRERAPISPLPDAPPVEQA